MSRFAVMLVQADGIPRALSHHADEGDALGRRDEVRAEWDGRRTQFVGVIDLCDEERGWLERSEDHA